MCYAIYLINVILRENLSAYVKMFITFNAWLCSPALKNTEKLF